MGNDIPGKFLGIFLAFILTVIMPFVTVSVEEEMINRRLIICEITSFIDGVVDNRKITDAMIDELNVSLASYGVSVDYEIKRYSRSVNSDPLNPGDYFVTYLAEPDIVNYNKGDKISVRVFTVGYSTTQSLATRLSGMFINDLDETITARIR